MKKFNKYYKKINYLSFLFFIFFVITKTHAQDYQISFAGIGAGTTVDSVKVENLTQCKSKSIGGNDILRLLGTIGINESNKYVENKIRIYPTPMVDNCSIEFETAVLVNAAFELFDITGRRIVKEQTRLTSGIHLYSISGLSSGVYFLRINSGTFSHTAKILCINSRKNSFQIGYKGVIALDVSHNSLSTSVSNKKPKGDKDIIEMQYTAGDRLKFTGFSGGIYRTIFMLIPSNSQTITFNFVSCTDADGNNYPVVQIGTQLWMAENLKTTKFRNSEIIPNVTSNTVWNGLTTGAYCNYKNTLNPDTINTYGRLYNWYSVNDSRNVAPAGWHVPTDAEWGILGDFLGGQNTAGGKLKGNCSNYWQAPNIGATNESGFTARPNGYRFLDGSFDEMGNWSVLWCSTSSSANGAPTRALFFDDAGFGRDISDKRDGFAVRCVKN